MHRFSSIKALNYMRLNALFFIVQLCAVVILIGFILVVLLKQDPATNRLFLKYLFAVSVFSFITFCISFRSRCPLCIVSVFNNKQCSKSKRAKKLLFSYRLQVAVDVIMLKSYRCPYCGERVAMEVRQHKKNDDPITP